jgi:hypothetical protein
MVKSWLGSIFFVILNVVEAAILFDIGCSFEMNSYGIIWVYDFLFFIFTIFKIANTEKKNIYFEIIFGWLGNLRQNWKKIGYNFNII